MDEKKSVEMVIRDFKKPAVNPLKNYLLNDTTIKAIEEFVKRENVLCELAPLKKKSKLFGEEAATARSLIDVSNAAAQLSSLSFDRETGVVKALVTPVAPLGKNIFEDIEKGTLVFGLRGVVDPRFGDLVLQDIVTFDLIAT